MWRKGYRLRRVSLLLAITVVLTGFTVMPIRVTAAVQSDDDCETMSIGINGTIKVEEYLIKRSKASYIFKSTKTSVAKVNSKGTITGLKVGRASIKITEKYKGKKTYIGSVKVAVRKANIAKSVNYEISLESGYYTKNYITINFLSSIHYLNPKATYTITSSDPSKVKVSLKGVILSASGVDGEVVNLVIKETYNNKTRKVGTVEAFFSDYSKYNYGDEEEDF